jgi:FKBP-type peptidyl-prolyl cis-trans isomerase FkpA
MRRTSPRLIKVACLAVPGFGAACSSIEVSGPDVVFQVIEETTFDPSLEIDLTQMTKLASGVYIQDLVVGEGAEFVAGDLAEVSYQGWLSNGVLFDQGQFSFLSGNQEVIPGFELGVLGMKVGGTRKLVIPPELGYGASFAGSIPPGSILVFDVDLVATM